MQISLSMMQSIFGFIFFIGLSYCFSDNRRAINWRLIVSAFILLNILFLVIRYVPIANTFLSAISSGLVGLLDHAKEGARFIFGDLVDTQKYGFIFAFVILPTLVFFGSIVSILYFFGILQRVIAFLAFLLRKTVKLSGVESLVVIADIFLGQAEGPLLIGPYVKNMTKSELACAFTAGLANISGSTLGIYLSFLAGTDKAQIAVFANYLVTASFMNAISAIIFAKILFPETNYDMVSTEKVNPLDTHFSGNIIDSIFKGATTGAKIAVSMFTVLIAVIAIIHALDAVLAWFGDLVNINEYIKVSTNSVFSSLSLEYLLGVLFRVFAFFMGINWVESLNVGSLLGQKVVINEFIAYMSLGQMKLKSLLSEHAIFISTFALASFSNFSSIGISMGVYSVLSPERQSDLSKIAFKALFGAVIAGFMTATVAGFWHGILG